MSNLSWFSSTKAYFRLQLLRSHVKIDRRLCESIDFRDGYFTDMCLRSIASTRISIMRLGLLTSGRSGSKPGCEHGIEARSN